MPRSERRLRRKVVVLRKRLQMLTGVVMTACMLPVLTSAYFVTRPRAPEQAVRVGRFSREQVLARSRPLLPALMVGSTVLSSELSRNRSYGASGKETPTWAVDCSDSVNGKKARLVWNADTGELLYASQWKDRVPALPVGAPTTRHTAIALTWDWFHALPVRKDHESWRVVTADPRSDTQWIVKLQCADCVAMFTVNAATGQLVWMVCTHLPGSKIDRNVGSSPGIAVLL
ncbi:MAG: hypothetical protein JWL77_6466 [Chthonomonadaceae bacterium]|nr:hypothetical protein [Chthonomonadaceae bacterium]